MPKYQMGSAMSIGRQGYTARRLLHCKDVNVYVLCIKSGCQRKPGKMLKISTEGGQQNKFILTSQIGLVE